VRLVAFVQRGGAEPRAGALLAATGASAELVLDLEAPALDLARPRRENDAFELGGAFLRGARAAAARCADAREVAALRERGAVLPLAEVELRAPVPRPGKIVCIGKNYKEHADETGSQLPERPLLFSKFPSAVNSPGALVRIPRGSRRFDYEAELGVVIGSRAARVPRARALEHVLGYCCFDDLTARDFQKLDGQWQRGKSCDGTAPFGPFVATADEVPDPHALRIRLRLNGETMQDSHTSLLIFGVDVLIESISEHVTLEPGDVIATGTPGGVGFARNPPVYLAPGDVVEVEIDGLGVLRNTIAASD
jgi:2-keto-4-pentenoate hydratase/2-oxohepta-3-ene-1,7-dioic acid hydratase in catechol pathway